MKAILDGLPEGLKLSVTQTQGYTVVAVDKGSERLGKLYIHSVGVILASGNANRQSGKAVAWAQES